MTITELLARSQPGADWIDPLAPAAPIRELISSGPGVVAVFQTGGLSGEIRFHRLPWELARWLGPCTRDARVLLNSQLLPRDAGATRWDDWLRAQPASTIEMSDALPSVEALVWEGLAAALPQLSPRDMPPSHELRAAIDQLCRPIRDSVVATALAAGILQMNDALSASHEQSQQIEGQGDPPLGDAWHAIMHRREPDYGNAKYWFRRVGEQPGAEELAAAAQLFVTLAPGLQKVIHSGRWDPIAFVDFCQTTATSRERTLQTVAQSLQWIEMLLLLKATWQAAERS